ncbi:MAG: cytochrome c [Planctomycetota bacterium]|nr:cytochrome c [Planctomycetota bacterium]
MPRFTSIATALVALAGAAFLSSCPDAGPSTGPELYRAWGCVNCHAENGSGVGGLGPTLNGKQSHWSSDTLTQYLRNPTGFAAKDARLKEQGRNFMSPMPPVLVQDEAAVARLVEHVSTLLR